MQLHRDDLVEVAKTNHDLQTQLFKIKAQLAYKGSKYDFYQFQRQTKDSSRDLSQKVECDNIFLNLCEEEKCFDNTKCKPDSPDELISPLTKHSSRFFNQNNCRKSNY